MRDSITLPIELAGQNRLIDAVIAVNEAPTLAAAFQVLAETGLDLLGANHLWVVVWSDELTVGEVAAAAGGATEAIGERLLATAESIESIATGEPSDGLSPGLVAKLGGVATVVRVPLLTESCRATFHAAWDTPLSGAEATEAARLLHTLTRLTTLAERTLHEREQHQLTHVLDGVADGVVLTTSGRTTTNAAARAILALPEESDFRSSMFNPRTLDGTPYDLDSARLLGWTVTQVGHGGRFTIRATASTAVSSSSTAASPRSEAAP